MKKWFIYSIAICLFLPIAVNAQISNQMAIGARPIGLGGAFSAVANDGNAIFWNPAGIVTLQRQEIITMYSSLYKNLGMENSYLGYVMPLGDNHAFGVDWLHLGMDDTELGFRRDSFNLAYSLRLPSIGGWNWSVGSKLKFVDTDITLDGTSLGQANGYGFDFGLIVNPVENLRFAVVGRDVGGTSVTYDVTSEEILPPLLL